MKKLNIAFFTDSYLPGVDGVVTSILTFKKELEKRGHNVYIFAASDIKSKKRLSNSKIFLYSGVEFKPYPQYNVALFPYNSLFKLRDLDIDIIHVQTPFVMGFAGMMSAKILRYPLIGSFHTLINNRPVVNHYYPKNKSLKKITTRYMMRYLRFFYKKCNTVIAPTKTIEKLLNGYDIRNTTVVSNCIDSNVFNPNVNGSGERRALGIKSKEKMVLYLGRLSREKRVEVMLRAAKILSKRNNKIKFVIGGTGPAEPYYKNLASRLSLKNVKFIGFVKRETVPKLYAACDLFCLPSTFETQGIVCLEAMAVGKPVVGANYLAMKEIIKNGKNGEKFEPGDYTKCAQKIEKVLNSPGYYRENAIKFSRDFTADKVTDRLLDVYNLLLRRQAIY